MVRGGSEDDGIGEDGAIAMGDMVTGGRDGGWTVGSREMVVGDIEGMKVGYGRGWPAWQS